MTCDPRSRHLQFSEPKTINETQKGAQMISLLGLARTKGGLFLLAALMTALGTYFLLTEDTARCGSEKMSVGDVCETERRGIVTLDTYEDKLHDNRLNTVAGWASAASPSSRPASGRSPLGPDG
jgi:hypothetical protein